MAAELPDDVVGRLTRHIFDLRQFENKSAKDVTKALEQISDDATSAIERMRLGEVKNFAVRKKRLDAIIKQVDTMIDEGYTGMKNQTKQVLQGLSRTEADFATLTLQDSLGSQANINLITGANVLNAPLIKQIIEVEPIQGLQYATWWDDVSRSSKVEFRRRLQTGLAQGESTDQLVRRVRGRAAINFKDGMFRGLAKNKVTAIVRTGVNHVSNRVHFETYSRNKRVTEEYEYIATLDDRTSPICILLDGETWNYEDPKARIPPQHPNCRSTILPIIKYKELGLKPPVGKSFRASGSGPVKGGTRYEQWLRNQDKTTQAKILGDKRASLFRNNKASFSQMIRTDGRLLTLDELEAKNLGLPIPVKGKPKFEPLLLFDTSSPDYNLLAENYAPLNVAITDNQRGALHVWKGDDFEDISYRMNGVTGFHKSISDKTAKGVIKEMDNVFANPKSILKHDVVTFRGMRPPKKILDRFSSPKNSEKLIGMEFTDKSYIATTFDPAIANSFVRDEFSMMTEIRIPKALKQKAIPLDLMGINTGMNEAELLLPPKTKFRIIGIKRRFDPNKFFDLSDEIQDKALEGETNELILEVIR